METIRIARSLQPRLTLALPVIALLAAMVSAACTSTATSESTGQYIDDSVINNKVRGQLVGDPDLNLFQIDVDTYKGVIQLSGFVGSDNARDRAGRVAASVDGVRNVRNNLVVK